jgi:hypothetical protein
MNKNKYLLIAIGLLLIILVWDNFIVSNNDRNFKEVLISLDTTLVTKIDITTKNNQEERISFTRTQGSWMVSLGAINDEADQSSVRGMLAALVELKPERLVAKDDSKWHLYEVSDSLGARVQIYHEGNLSADLMIGKFSFDQNTRAMSTYVRLSDEHDTYSVEGLLNASFNQEFNNFRDQVFLNLSKEDITSLQFGYPGDSSFSLTNLGDKWHIDNQAIDSTAIDVYLNGIRNLTHRTFNDDFSNRGVQATYKLTIDGNNMGRVEVNVYADGANLIMHSSQNENAYFDLGTFSIFEKLLVSQKVFLPKEQDGTP